MQELLPKGLAETVPPLYATEGEADPVVERDLAFRPAPFSGAAR